MLEPELSAQILDCFYYVYRERGYGFLENVYANSLAAELEYRGVSVRREEPVELFHRGKPVGTYRIDLLVGHKILVEVKSTLKLGTADERQLVNYLADVALVASVATEAVRRYQNAKQFHETTERTRFPR
jgi:GxxExxY protein